MKFFKPLVFALLLLLVSEIKAEAAASLSLSPTAGGTSVGQTFTVEIKLNTKGASTSGTDAVITFNPAVLEVTAFNQGTLYSSGQPNPTIDNITGKITYHPSVTNTAYNYTTAGLPGTLATITFKGKSPGNAQVVFTCTAGSTQESNVWSTNQDIISCTENIGGSYTITAASGSNPNTITPTTPPVTNFPPDQLPESGVMEWTLLIFAVGIFFIFGGTKLLLAKNELPSPEIQNTTNKETN